ncbi:hypothetical protein ISCGN_011401 [Ixodes scapularis]
MFPNQLASLSAPFSQKGVPGERKRERRKKENRHRRRKVSERRDVCETLPACHLVPRIGGGGGGKGRGLWQLWARHSVSQSPRPSRKPVDPIPWPSLTVRIARDGFGSSQGQGPPQSRTPRHFHGHRRRCHGNRLPPSLPDFPSEHTAELRVPAYTCEWRIDQSNKVNGTGGSPNPRTAATSPNLGCLDQPQPRRRVPRGPWGTRRKPDRRPWPTCRLLEFTVSSRPPLRLREGGEVAVRRRPHRRVLGEGRPLAS